MEGDNTIPNTEKEEKIISTIKSKKSLIATIVFYLAIVFLIFGLSYIVFLLKSQGSECVKNPFVYGAKNSVGISSHSGGSSTPHVSCSCQVYAQGLPSTTFCFNEVEVSKDCFAGSQDLGNVSFKFSE